MPKLFNKKNAPKANKTQFQGILAAAETGNSLINPSQKSVILFSYYKKRLQYTIFKAN
ncbi:MAG: hypothetical protein UR94_C0011G0008 [Parcubacteria group bacterium GW2011_GWA2_36_10]|nr:MAG: hypothetical protein UR94_C0011G0008 [Parcubacteria group bacterium GW2011_GWA2_36_10]